MWLNGVNKTSSERSLKLRDAKVKTKVCALLSDFVKDAIVSMNATVITEYTFVWKH